MNKKKAIILKARIAFLGVLVFAMAIVGRVAFLQIVDGPKYRKMLTQKLVKRRLIRPTRGNIYSDNGGLMATSIPKYRLAFDPTLAKKTILLDGIDSLSDLLARHYRDRPAADYKRKLLDARSEGKEFIYINTDYIGYQDKKRMANWPIFRLGKQKGGVIFEKQEYRFNPFVMLGAKTLGTTRDDTGRNGLEFYYNRELGGQPGEGIFRKIAGGYWKPLYELAKPVRGQDIQTTLDVNIQDVAEASLLSALERHQAAFGCAVVMKVETGEIKAIANLGKNKDGSYSENYNYAVARRTEPGSTFKLASYMAMLEEEYITPETPVNLSKGAYYFGDAKMEDSEVPAEDNVTAQRAFEISSNVGTSKLVQGCFGKTPTKYLDYIEKFGLSTPLGMQLKGERASYIKNVQDQSWSGITLPWMSVGYESELTPMQILAFYNAVANNGTMMQPILVREIRDGEHVISTFEPKVLRKNIASEATLAIAKQFLIGVVENGTARAIKNTEYQIAGKTGTAKKIINHRYTEKYYTSFCGFFPAEKPKYSCIVVIDEPKGINQHGADVAAPVFKDISEKINSLEVDMHKPLPKAEVAATDFPTIAAGSFADLHFLCNKFSISNYAKGAVDEWVRATTANRSVQWRELKDHNGRMPNVKGMHMRDALYMLENQGYRVLHTGKGRVQEQHPQAGTTLRTGNQISLLLR